MIKAGYTSVTLNHTMQTEQRSPTVIDGGRLKIKTKTGNCRVHAIGKRRRGKSRRKGRGNSHQKKMKETSIYKLKYKQTITNT